MRSNTLILCFTWFVTAFVYYGFAFNFGDLGGNLFINFLTSAGSEVIADGVCLLGLSRFSRRKFLFTLLSGVFLGSMVAIPFYLFRFKGSFIISLILSLVSKFFVSCCFIAIYNLSSEIYPTVVRQIGMGANSAVARVGGILAPFIHELSHFTHITAALALFAGLSLVNAFLVLLLPETKGREVPDTIEEAENRDNEEAEKSRAQSSSSGSYASGSFVGKARDVLFMKRYSSSGESPALSYGIQGTFRKKKVETY
jgi:MFS family permease